MTCKDCCGWEDAALDQTCSAANIDTRETSTQASLIGTSLKFAALECFGNFWSSTGIEPGEWIEDRETEGHLLNPFSEIKPASPGLPIFVWFLIKDQSSPIFSTKKHNSSAGNGNLEVCRMIVLICWAQKNTETYWWTVSNFTSGEWTVKQEYCPPVPLPISCMLKIIIHN